MASKNKNKMNREQEHEGQENKFPGFGESLAKARDAQQKDLESLAQELRLDSWVLEAIESEDLSKLPEPIFARGYIKNYAKALGVDSDPLIDLYNQKIGSEPKVDTSAVVPASTGSAVVSRSKKGVLFPVMVVVAAIIIALLVWQLWPITESEQSVESDITDLQALPIQEEVSNEIALPDEDLTQESDLQEEELAEEMVVEVPQPTIKQDHLTLSAETESWAEVHDATGERVVFQLLKAGGSKTVEGVAPFKIFLGDARGITVVINGQNYDLARHIRKSNVARFELNRPNE